MMLRSASTIALALASQTLAQPAGEPPRDPPRLESRPEDAGVLPSVPDQSIPGLDTRDVRLKQATLLPEGTFIVRRRGSLVRSASGVWLFAFHPGLDGASDRPMVFSPCAALARLESMASGEAAPASFNVSGQVFSYRGVNYLLPTIFSPVTTDAVTNSSEPASDPKADPAVAALLRELEAARDQPRVLEPPTATAIDEQARGWAEGATIVRRRGRLTRLSGGERAFVSDGDTDTRADPPLVVMPCAALARMESIVVGRGEDVAMELSGKVYAYGGRNYVLPTLYRVLPPTELRPMQ